MPWRLIIVFVIFAVFLVFITFNLDNRCDVSFGFAVINDVPVFLTVFLSFALGLFCTFPLLLRSMKTKKDKPGFEKPAKEKTPLVIKSRFFKKNENNPDSGPYEKI